MKSVAIDDCTRCESEDKGPNVFYEKGDPFEIGLFRCKKCGLYYVAISDEGGGMITPVITDESAQWEGKGK